jgi:ribosomal-protein-alanine N-acetyltransferase
MERVTLDHYTGNLAGNLYLKLGFKYEGIMRHAAKKDGKYYDLHLMSMLREEYFDLKKKS